MRALRRRLADPARPEARALLQRMAHTLRHRGPDGEGFHAAPGVGPGFRRLSIIELETGNQPIANEDGSVVAWAHTASAVRHRMPARIEGGDERMALAFTSEPGQPSP